MLKCNTCGLEKEEELFVLRKERRNKYRNICKVCYSANQRINYYKRKKDSPFIMRHQKMVSSTKQRNIPYNLTPEFLKFIWTGFCPVSGEEIFFPEVEEDRVDENAAELDRFDPSKGYIKGNVTWISRKYNRKKLDSSLEELENLVAWMKAYKPIQEGSIEIDKPKQIPWNKGAKTPNSTPLGEENPTSILKENDVRNILKQYTGKRGQIVSMAKDYGVSPATIRKIVKRQTWKHIK
jgi:hypothetical protein